MHGPTPSIFSFACFSVVVPYGLIEFQAPMLRLHFLGYPSHSVTSLGALGHTFLAYPWPSLASFLSVFRSLSWWPLLSSIPPQPVQSIGLGYCLCQAYIFWCYLRSQFIVHFHRGPPAWHVSCVPCSSRSLVYWCFYVVLSLLPIV